jgi:hypothetical protein
MRNAEHSPFDPRIFGKGARCTAMLAARPSLKTGAFAPITATSLRFYPATICPVSICEGASMPRIPGKDKFLAGVAAYDGNNQVYFEAQRGLQTSWGDPTKMADAIWPWLRCWHADYYRYGQDEQGAIPRRIACGIEQHLSLLMVFGTARSTLCALRMSLKSGSYFGRFRK